MSKPFFTYSGYFSQINEDLDLSKRKTIEDDDYDIDLQLEIIPLEKKKSNAEIMSDLLHKINLVEIKREEKKKKAV